MDAYAEAEKVDKILRRIVEKNDIKANKREFKLFCRTVRSTIDIIDAATEDEKFLDRWLKKENDDDGN
ncbi:MAG: hypothetical protein BV459_06680 [Thermoplasmata archaeon M11B2D]|nr:MAG: hypothetical protein BV459_06680 [Thermoplasmata archaeon M11B2D]PNX51202.1 MAG: hypothetical protein BV458_11850 [Thermoplasmata archaeon M9B2D]